MNYTEAAKMLGECGQEHVLADFKKLSKRAQSELLGQIAKIEPKSVRYCQAALRAGGDVADSSKGKAPKVAVLKGRALAEAVAAGEADCIVSAGNTGALLTGATLIIKRIDGVRRPALAPVLPTKTGGHVLLLDSGANTDCKPQYLQQFALMGAAYMEKVMGVKNPRIGLLNNGAEAEKGNELTKAVYPLLQNTPVNFAGNCEARETLSGDFDVVVADGFDGNVLLKS